MKCNHWSAGVLLAASLTAAHAAEALTYFSERPENTGATTFNIGDRFNGPGVVTVGWLGSKKQVVLPAGEWVVLAAADHDGGGIRPAKLATVLFGKFARTRLVTMLGATFNRHAASTTRWLDVEACADERPNQLWHVSTSPSSLSGDCVEMRAEPRAVPSEKTPLGAELHANLRRMGGTVRGPAIVTRMYFDEKRSGYLRIVRTDWPETPDVLKPSEARADYVKGLIDRVEAYRPLASVGFRKNLDVDDLRPGALAATASPVVAALARFKDD